MLLIRKNNIDLLTIEMYEEKGLNPNNSLLLLKKRVLTITFIYYLLKILGLVMKTFCVKLVFLFSL